MIDIESIEFGKPQKVNGRRGTILIDRIFLGVAIGWQLHYCDEVFLIRRKEEVVNFLKKNLLPAPLADLGDVEEV